MRLVMKDTEYPLTPPGKRRIHTNIWGNTNGYVGSKRFWEFGSGDYEARLWVDGKSLRQVYEGED